MPSRKKGRATGAQEEDKKWTKGGHRARRRGHSRRRTRGQEEDKRRRGGKEQPEDKVWRPAGSRGQATHQKKDKRTKGVQKRSAGGQHPDTAFTRAARLWPGFFLTENPNNVEFLRALLFL